MSTTFEFISITDERTSCECCGRTGLKRTVVLRDDDGTFVFYGTVCAARALGWNDTRNRAARRIETLRQARAAFDASVQHTKKAIRDRGVNPRRYLPAGARIEPGILVLTDSTYGWEARIEFKPLMHEYQCTQRYQALIAQNEHAEYAGEWLRYLEAA